MTLVQYDNMIQTVSPDAADGALYERGLPWTPWRDEHFLDAHVPDPLPEVNPIDAVPIS